MISIIISLGKYLTGLKKKKWLENCRGRGPLAGSDGGVCDC